jgi:hypothetical protein
MTTNNPYQLSINLIQLSDTLCQRGRYYSYEGKESNQRLINTKKNQRHIDRGRSPKESSVRGSNPKGRDPFPLISKGER